MHAPWTHLFEPSAYILASWSNFQPCVVRFMIFSEPAAGAAAAATATLTAGDDVSDEKMEEVRQPSHTGV